MNARIRASSNKIEHITHLLNQSTAKVAFSFQKSQRFQLNKSFSPNKFYDSTSSLGKRSCSFGIGHRHSLEKLDYTEPARYRIASAFDTKKSDHNQSKFTSFGISRESFYKGKQQKLPLGPGTYNLRDPIGSKPFYMGHRLQPKRDKNPLSSCSYTIKKEAYSKLSNYKNQGNIKMKTEYFPKDTLHPYKTEVPGPGSYSQRSAFSQGSGSYSQRRKANSSSFGVGQRLKSAKPDKLGPGTQQKMKLFSKRFSQFGNNL